MMCWGVGLLSTALTSAGCASVPRPVPVSNEPVAQAQAANVVVSVPRLDQGDYPGDILEVSTAVLVVIENRGTSDILINPDGFTLGSPEGMHYSPIAPEQLVMRQVKPEPGLNQSGVALAWHGGGGGGHMSFGGGGGGGGHMSFGGGIRSAPAYHGGMGGGVHIAPPAARPWGGGYMGRPGYYGHPGYYGRPGFGYYGRSFYGYGGPMWWGAYNPWLWGPGYGYGWYGSSIWWDTPRYYAWSRADAARMALPAGKLPPGGRTGGFLYFPRIDRPEGSTVYLQWQIRDATTTQPIGEVQVPLELSSQ
jgi:hypothetical protein